MKYNFALYVLILLLAGGAVGACQWRTADPVEREIDSLNRKAYAMRYVHLDSTRILAQQAWKRAANYPDGRVEATITLAFCHLMRMDFEQAVRLYERVYELSNNELDRLIADIGLMKVYQRTALYKEFYDCRNNALRRMRRIDEEADLFVNPHEKARLDYARSELQIVSAVYYYYLQQRSQAMECMQRIAGDPGLEADTAQLLYYHYIKGAASLCDGRDADQVRLREFDELFFTYRLAREQGLLYFEANALQGIASLICQSDNFQFFIDERFSDLARPGEPVDTLLPLRLAEQALAGFTRYNDLYQIAGTRVTMAKYLNQHGRYSEALQVLTEALECVNRHHRQMYACNDSTDWLKTYDSTDTLYIEKQWMKQRLMTVPEWISRIREQLCVAYSGLGMKAASDYNRNIYLDILDDTRQDKEWENRYEALQHESTVLNVITAAVVGGILLMCLLFWLFNRNWKRRNKRQLQNLQHVLEVCRRIATAIPQNAQSDDEIAQGILAAASNEFDQNTLRKVIEPYIEWGMNNGRAALRLDDETRQLEEQRSQSLRQMALNKRENMVKKACVALVVGMQPYIDRILNEVRKLSNASADTSRELTDRRYAYIDELVTTINERNEMLARWIKVKQGKLSLHIENFELNNLFDLIRKGERAFSLKRIELEVVPTEAVVKADRALTLFMINTLADNARKFTPQGGRVKIDAQCHEQYVEIAVTDNGPGLSQEEIANLEARKYYDEHRASGFGLMNCRGIVEKYRKTGAIFNVCAMGIQSEPGKGSRFYFRLPIGVKRLLVWIAMMGGSIGMAGAQTDADTLLNRASDYANEAYYANVDGFYEQALCYIDSAIQVLNRHYDSQPHEVSHSMALEPAERPAELYWWDEAWPTDYHVVLDLRNEAAVAALALKRWDLYTYNNIAYTTLYKLLGEDQSLEEYCRMLRRQTGNKTVGMVLACLLLAALPVGFYFIYLRKRLVMKWNLEQILEINRKVLAASTASGLSVREEDSGTNRMDIPQRIADHVFAAVNEMVAIEWIGIGLYTPEGGEEWVGYPRQAMLADNGIADPRRQDFSLTVESVTGAWTIGTLSLMRVPGTQREDDRLLIEWVARYMAIVLYNATLKMEDKSREQECARDEAGRAAYEDALLHVQNQVLDNCLSTIKHETAYYPNRIKFLVSKLQTGEFTAAEEREMVKNLGELIEYYKGVFSLLCGCALRQLDEVTFRRTRIEVSAWLHDAQTYCKRMAKGRRIAVQVDCGQDEKLSVWGDREQLGFLLENLIDEALTASVVAGCAAADVDFTLTAEPQGDKVLIRFIDLRRNFTENQLHELFYPHLEQMLERPNGQLGGTEYLVCKQIVREHDEYCGHRGCAIWGQPSQQGKGFEVCISLLRAD